MYSFNGFLNEGIQIKSTLNQNSSNFKVLVEFGINNEMKLNELT